MPKWVSAISPAICLRGNVAAQCDCGCGEL